MDDTDAARPEAAPAAAAPGPEGAARTAAPPPTPGAVGVDGCRGGWVAVRVEGGQLVARVHPTFVELVESYPHVGCIAIDIPIGLSTGGARACDKAARRLLGPRASSVFPAPDPRLLGDPDFAAVNERSRQLTGKGVSVQAFGLFPKVAEVAEAMSPLAQSWVVEVHPEVCLWAMNGHVPMAHSKSTPAGYEERRALLARTLGVRIPAKADAAGLVKGASPDDVLDAAAALWTAHRAVAGVAERVTEQPEVDRRGLRMEMVY